MYFLFPHVYFSGELRGMI